MCFKRIIWKKIKRFDFGSFDDGMISVEMAVIVPVLSVLIVGVVFLMLFFVDMAAVKGEAMLISNEVADCWKTEGDLVTGDYVAEKLIKRNITFLLMNQRKKMISRAETRLGKRLEERLFLTEITQKKVRIQSGKVITKVTVQFLWPIGKLSDYMGTKGLCFTCSSVSPVQNQEEQLRKIKSKEDQNGVER